MSSSHRAPRPAVPPVPADPSGREPAGTLAGLIDVLDRADGGSARQRSRPAAHRTARPAPLRSVQPAPPARVVRVPAAPVPRVTVVPERVREPLGGVRGFTRRMALWGAGEQGENLAWRTPAQPLPEPGRRRAALRAFTRRMAQWGAGDRGEHLAWGGSARPGVARLPSRLDLDPPVVLRELPSTPSIQPVASSPAAALVPAGPASSPGSRTGTAASDATARPCPVPSSTEPAGRAQPRVGWRPPRDRPSSGRYGARSTPPSLPVRSSGTSRASGMPAPRSPGGSGGAGARGDPSGHPVRGSPAPPRRTGPANGTFPSPFPVRAPSSHPRPAPPAPG